jgi:hypothetical protein
VLYRSRDYPDPRANYFIPPRDSRQARDRSDPHLYHRDALLWNPEYATLRSHVTHEPKNLVKDESCWKEVPEGPMMNIKNMLLDGQFI